MPPNRKFFGCVTRRERWGLSARGWLALAYCLALLAAMLWLLNVQPFRAQTRRVDTKVVVVEGWIHEYAARAALADFNTGD